MALLDIELPGHAAAWTPPPSCATQAPDCRVLILTTFGRPGYLRRAMEAGAAGFLVKDGPVEELAAAIRRVLTGETRHRPGARRGRAERRAQPAHRPRARRPERLGGRRDGRRHRGQLHLSESTVRNYLSSAIGKTGTRNRMEAVRAARQQGWL